MRPSSLGMRLHKEFAVLGTRKSISDSRMSFSTLEEFIRPNVLEGRLIPVSEFFMIDIALDRCFL
jgi:hypothetical protein